MLDTKIQICPTLCVSAVSPTQGANQNWSLYWHAQESFKREKLQNPSPYGTE